MKKKNIFLRLVVGIVLILVSVFLLYKFNIEAAQEYINSYGSFAAIIFILLFSVRTLFIIFPHSLMLVLSGSIFGPALGLLYSMISTFISATLAFVISRYGGKDFVRRILGSRVEKLDLKIEQHGFKIIFFMRLSAILPFDIINFAAGLTKVKYKDFILGVMLGVIPEAVLLTYVGTNLKDPLSFEFLLSILLMIILVGLPFLFKKIYKNSKHN